MKSGKLLVVLGLVACTWLSASPAPSAAPAAPAAQTHLCGTGAIDDPEPISCPMCGGDAGLHARMVQAFLAMGASEGVRVLRLVFG